MSTVKGVAYFISAGTLAATQYLLGAPWRYVLLAIEFMVLAYVVLVLWNRVKNLTVASAEHQARLEAIAKVAEKSKVVHEANRIVDAIITASVEREHYEPVDSQE